MQVVRSKGQKWHKNLNLRKHRMIKIEKEGISDCYGMLGMYLLSVELRMC